MRLHFATTSSTRRVALPRLFTLLALALLGTVALAACAPSASSDPTLAMRVNGTGVSLSSYQQALALFAASNALQGGGASGFAAWQSPADRKIMDGAKGDTRSFFVSLLALKQEAAAQGVQVSSRDIAAAEAQLQQQVAQARSQLNANPNNTGLRAEVDAITPDVVQMLAEQQAYSVALATKGKAPTAHVRGILVQTQAAANATLKDLQGGADFATLARQRSTDASTAAKGGDLGTVYVGEFVSAFDTKIFKDMSGTGYAVIQFPSGWGVFQVLSRGQASLSAVNNTQSQQQYVNGWISDVLAPQAKVEQYVN